MKTTLLALLSTSAALVWAQSQTGPSLAGLPTCAQNAALAGASTSGCQLSDAKCFCMNSAFIGGLEGAISNQCSGDDQITACAWGNAACSQYGITFPCLSTEATPAAEQSSTVAAMDSSEASATAAVAASGNSTNSTTGPAMVTGSGSCNSGNTNSTWTSSPIPSQTKSTVGSSYTGGAASSAVFMQSNLFAVMIVGVAAGFAAA